MNELNFYHIGMKYIRNLSKIDDNIMSVSPQMGKENRPFVILNRANKVYRAVTLSPQKNRNLVRRCCDFKKLEVVPDKYLAARSQEKTSGAEHSSNSRPAEAARQQVSPRSGFPLSRDAIKKSAEIIRRKEEEKGKDKPQEKKHDKSNDLS